MRVLVFLFYCLLRLRYRVFVKGVENVPFESLNKVIFLANHTAHPLDVFFLMRILQEKAPTCFLKAEGHPKSAFDSIIATLFPVVPYADFSVESNSYIKNRSRSFMASISKQIEHSHLLLFPAGYPKLDNLERITSPFTYELLKVTKDTPVVLTRVTGLWGSFFSEAFPANKSVSWPSILFLGIKTVLKNGLFLVPKREITIEFTPQGTHSFEFSSAAALNAHLERWFNRPDGIRPSFGRLPGESLAAISYSFWGKDFPEGYDETQSFKEIDIKSIPEEVQLRVLEEMAKLSQLPVTEIHPSMRLSEDLGLDSVDKVELLAALDAIFHSDEASYADMSTVGSVMAWYGETSNGSLHLRKMQSPSFQGGARVSSQKRGWKTKLNETSQKAQIAHGNTLYEAFFNRCEKDPSSELCVDVSGTLITCRSAKERVILLAQKLTKYSGPYIGIMLPSCNAVYLLVMACQLAGKIPLMINWTTGRIHLEAVRKETNVSVVLSSLEFLKKLDYADLSPLQDIIIPLEDIRKGFSTLDYMRAWLYSRSPLQRVLAHFGVQDTSEEAIAVLLFTSGTENLPKGVPLSHKNILANQKAALEMAKLHKNDIMLGTLPPFHSFGFTMSGLLPLLSGMRAVYYPNPTDGVKIREMISSYGATVICGAPTFLKNLFHMVKQDELKTLKLCFSGGEKTPKDLFEVANVYECRLLEGYGVTECSPIITLNMTGGGIGGVGLPLNGLEVCVVNPETYKKVVASETGLVLVRGSSVFNGYLSQHLYSPFIEVDSKMWYATGDIGKIDAEGALHLLGRWKRFVKIAAEMVSLTAVEEVLEQKIRKINPGKDEPLVAVCAKEEAGEKTRLILFTAMPFDTESANLALKEAGFSNLVKIYSVNVVEKIPLMGSGKIHYKALEGCLNKQEEK